MLKQAIAARLPIIDVSTRDVINFPEVVQFITKKVPVEWGSGPAAIKPETLYMHVWHKQTGVDPQKLYKKLGMAESTLLMVNAPKPSDASFVVGDVPAPREMVLKFVVSVVGDPAKAKSLLSALGGCTLKEVTEAIKLTMARDNSLTTAGLTLTRKTCFQGSPGITQLDAHQDYYDPPPELVDYVKVEGKFFLEGDVRLMPKGILLDGPPGTGKTEGAKYIANQWGVPLFRIDLAGAKSKWHGDSEQNVAQGLAQLDNEEPCVVLFDEIEKLMGGSDSGDFGGSVNRSVLSQLLWWFQGHRTKVLPVLTTNNRKRLPPEMIREGRVDRIMTFQGVPMDKAMPFAKAVLATFGDKGKKVTSLQLTHRLKNIQINASSNNEGETFLPQALITEAVKSLVKATLSK